MGIHGDVWRLAWGREVGAPASSRRGEWWNEAGRELGNGGGGRAQEWLRWRTSSGTAARASTGAGEAWRCVDPGGGVGEKLAVWGAPTMTFIPARQSFRSSRVSWGWKGSREKKREEKRGEPVPEPAVEEMENLVR
ncbi:hypothetical protein TRIUR3_16245 [Triticum urartu]|uniref:Uncharacterized protein n=1 Tax=Triticum urartu TaxID=4572 RepID=M8B1J1_TRIUA|nr:hypothetical protein TRIUR3_16245 [Triticum urartu]